MKIKPSDHFSADIRLLGDFIGTDRSLVTFLHCTPTEQQARRIMEEGLIFENYLTHTSDHISGSDLIELNYFRLIRKSYGNYTVVIQIDGALIRELSRQIQNTPYHFSEIMGRQMRENPDPENNFYTLPQQFIRGYFDHIHNRAVRNPHFDPHYHPASFEENLERFLNKNKSK